LGLCASIVSLLTDCLFNNLQLLTSGGLLKEHYLASLIRNLSRG
jgi:hypothetical protein